MTPNLTEYQGVQDRILLVARYVASLDLDGYGERLAQTGRPAPATHPGEWRAPGEHAGDMMELLGAVQRLQALAREILSGPWEPEPTAAERGGAREAGAPSVFWRHRRAVLEHLGLSDPQVARAALAMVAEAVTGAGAAPVPAGGEGETLAHCTVDTLPPGRINRDRVRDTPAAEIDRQAGTDERGG